MPSTYNRACDVYQGFNARNDKFVPIGFVTSLKIGSAELAVDLTCSDPTEEDTQVTTVIVVSHIAWGLGITDAIYISGTISKPNRETIKMLTYTDLSDVSVEIVYTIYNYDSSAKTYFKEFHSEETTLSGLLEKTGGDIVLDVSDSKSGAIEYPEVYDFTIGVKPQPTAQILTVQVSETGKVAKDWGITLAA